MSNPFRQGALSHLVISRRSFAPTNPLRARRSRLLSTHSAQASKASSAPPPPSRFRSGSRAPPPSSSLAPAAAAPCRLLHPPAPFAHSHYIPLSATRNIFFFTLNQPATPAPNYGLLSSCCQQRERLLQLCRPSLRGTGQQILPTTGPPQGHAAALTTGNNKPRIATY